MFPSNFKRVHSEKNLIRTKITKIHFIILTPFCGSHRITLSNVHIISYIISVLSLKYICGALERMRMMY